MWYWAIIIQGVTTGKLQDLSVLYLINHMQMNLSSQNVSLALKILGDKSVGCMNIVRRLYNSLVILKPVWNTLSEMETKREESFQNILDIPQSQIIPYPSKFNFWGQCLAKRQHVMLDSYLPVRQAFPKVSFVEYSNHLGRARKNGGQWVCINSTSKSPCPIDFYVTYFKKCHI